MSKFICEPIACHICGGDGIEKRRSLVLDGDTSVKCRECNGTGHFGGQSVSTYPDLTKKPHSDDIKGIPRRD